MAKSTPTTTTTNVPATATKNTPAKFSFGVELTAATASFRKFLGESQANRERGLGEYVDGVSQTTVAVKGKGRVDSLSKAGSKVRTDKDGFYSHDGNGAKVRLPIAAAIKLLAASYHSKSPRSASGLSLIHI